MAPSAKYKEFSINKPLKGNELAEENTALENKPAKVSLSSCSRGAVIKTPALYQGGGDGQIPTTNDKSVADCQAECKSLTSTGIIFLYSFKSAKPTHLKK